MYSHDDAEPCRSPSVPATFSGTITFSGAGDDEIKNLGKITYSIIGGQSFTSVGNVYLCGGSFRPLIEVTEFVASVFPDSNVEEGDYKSVYKAGAVEEIIDQMGEYYQLKSKGYIKKATVKVLETDAAELPEISRISFKSDERSERFVLEGAGDLPYWFEDEDGETRVTLFGNLKLPDTVQNESELFSEVRWAENDDGSLTATLRYLDPSKVWAVDVLYEDGETVLYAHSQPSLSTTPAGRFQVKASFWTGTRRKRFRCTVVVGPTLR